MKKILLSLSTMLVILATAFVACKTEPNNTTDEQEETTPVDKTVMLTNIFDNAITPAHETAVSASTDLVTSIETFVNAPTAINLSEAQSAWTASKMAWEALEVFEIPPINDLFLHNKVDKWPIKEVFLEENLDKNPDDLNEAFVENSGSTAKGFAAIEYLLFRAEDDNNILTQFTSGPRAAQYTNYLLALCQNLAKQSNLVKNEMLDSRITFIENIAEGINSSINELANAQVGILEEMLNKKINKPLGSNDLGIPQPQKVESPYTDVNLAAIRNNLLGIQYSLEADTTQVNLYSLLDETHTGNTPKLSTRIQNAINETYSALDNLNDAKLTDLIVNDTERLAPLTDALSKLIVAIKVDMANQLGLTIVFNDTDGD